MRAAGDRATIAPSARAAGRVAVPGDKSISHRYAMLAALADGDSVIRGYSRGADCASTLMCLRSLGVEIRQRDDCILIDGRGTAGLQMPDPSSSLDAGNSGTTMRLLAGILAGHPFLTQITGDASLRKRPMRRVTVPLELMGSVITSRDGYPPLIIHGGDLKGISYQLQVPSAQVKSCLLLAGLFADGLTEVDELAPTRDHTERALETFNVRTERNGTVVRIAGGQRLTACRVDVPGDISGAAFWAALAAGTPGGRITIENVGLNPTRTHLLELIRRAGGSVSVTPTRPDTEPVGTLQVAHADLNSFEITPEDVPLAIDEIPALAALAAMMPAGRALTVHGARELRVKESDRIASLADGFRAMGAKVDEFDDGFRLEARPLHAATVDAVGDHRLAMAFAIASTRASGPVTIIGASAVDVSYPGFFETLNRLTR